MSDNTPITQRLRKLASMRWTLSDKEVLNCCNNIDAIHKALEQENADLRDFCERVEQAAQAREDMTLFGADYKALPIGADGVSINVGDKGTVHNGNGIHEVKQLVFEGNCWWIGCKMEMASGTVKRMPSSFRHYKPTVENVLREFVTEFNCDDSELCDDEIIERFSKRLQLADGDGDE